MVVTSGPPSPGAPPVEVHIDLKALKANVRRLQALCAPSVIAPVVKADAYGLGVVRVAPVLAAAGCEAFFVSSVAEGLELRRVLPRVPIYLLEGAAGALSECAAHTLTPVLNTLEEIDQWIAAMPAVPVAVQIDTGMTRAGLSADDVERLGRDSERLSRLSLGLLITHLACADDPSHPLNETQVAAFERLVRCLPPTPTSIANSAGLFLSPRFRGDLVRPGLSLYGGRWGRAPEEVLEPVVSLHARILQIRALSTDAPVGYGATWVARAPARIATVGVGYADGYPRSLGNHGVAVVAGVRVPVVGRVSMDLITLDVSALPAEALAVGDRVELYGRTMPIEEVAERAGTVTYELLTRLSPRIPRYYHE